MFDSLRRSACPRAAGAPPPGVGTGREGFERYVLKIFDDVLSLRARAAHLLVVSNDVFSDGITYGEPTENYRRALGALHVKLADAADMAVECVAGLATLHYRGGR